MRSSRKYCASDCKGVVSASEFRAAYKHKRRNNVTQIQLIIMSSVEYHEYTLKNYYYMLTSAPKDPNPVTPPESPPAAKQITELEFIVVDNCASQPEVCCDIGKYLNLEKNLRLSGVPSLSLGLLDRSSRNLELDLCRNLSR